MKEDKTVVKNIKEYPFVVETPSATIEFNWADMVVFRFNKKMPNIYVRLIGRIFGS